MQDTTQGFGKLYIERNRTVWLGLCVYRWQERSHCLICPDRGSARLSGPYGSFPRLLWHLASRWFQQGAGAGGTQGALMCVHACMGACLRVCSNARALSLSLSYTFWNKRDTRKNKPHQDSPKASSVNLLLLFLYFSGCLWQQLHLCLAPPPARQVPTVLASTQWPEKPCLLPLTPSIWVVVTWRCSRLLGCCFKIHYCQCLKILQQYIPPFQIITMNSLFLLVPEYKYMSTIQSAYFILLFINYCRTITYPLLIGSLKQAKVN